MVIVQDLYGVSIWVSVVGYYNCFVSFDFERLRLIPPVVIRYVIMRKPLSKP